ncbi:MAG: GerMN domain-containing protein [Acidimicrobiales bacterium]
MTVRHARRRSPVPVDVAHPRRVVAVAAGALGALGLVLGLGGCGIPLATAQRISGHGNGRALSPVTTTTGPQTVKGYARVSVYLTTDGAYVLPEPRYLKPPAHLNTVVDLLLDGPQTSERYAGINTAIPSGVLLLTGSTSHGVVTLSFSVEFYNLSGTQEVLGIAQVVDTVDADKPGLAVKFEVNGVPIPVPLESGELATSPVRSTQYASLTFPTSTTTTEPA